MATRFLLDTNALTALANRLPTALAHLHALAPEDEVYACFVTAGEWEFGIRNAAGARRQAEIRAAGQVVLSTLDGVWESDPSVAIEYGAIAFELRAAGQQIPANDVWLAAIARVHTATLVTADLHFNRVSGLAVIDWTTP